MSVSRFCPYLVALLLAFAPFATIAQQKTTVPVSKPLANPSSTATLSTSANLSTTATAEANASTTNSIRALANEKRLATVSTVRLNTPLRIHGRFFLTATEAYIPLGKQAVQWNDHNGMAEMLAARAPAFPLHLGQQGAFNHLSFFGATPRDVAVMLNGRSLNDAALGACFLEQLPPEMVERTEILIGSDAIIAANNAAGAAINLQEVRHNTKNLYTRFWFQQASEQYTALDADISYNIAPNLNFSLGARTQTARRIYANTALNAWNARLILSWSGISNATVSLNYLFTQQRNALNGGLTTATLVDVNITQPLFYDLQESTFRHDLTLTGTAYLTRDSAVAASLTAYSTLNQRSLEKASLQGAFTANGLPGGGFLPVPDFFLTQATTPTFTIGATGRIETRVSLFPTTTATGSALEAALTAGGTVALHTFSESPYTSGVNSQFTSDRTGIARGEVAAFGRLAFTVLNSVNVSGGARFAVIGTRPELAIGAKAELLLSNSTYATVQFWADASRSFRAPSFDEETAFVRDTRRRGTDLLSEGHLLLLSGLRFRSAVHEFSSDIVASYRLVSNPVVSDTTRLPFYEPPTKDSIPLFVLGSLQTVRVFNAQTRSILGIVANADWQIRNILFNGNLVMTGFANATLISQTDGVDDRRFPLLYAGLTAQYEYIVGRSILRAGVRVRMMTAFRGERFSPLLWTYVASDLEQGLSGNGIDVVAGARVGNAYIRATYQNALGTTAFYVAGYPQFPSVLRLGVSWTILD
jgi:Putative porin/TonB-dependent Receptor Plug Domain